MPRVEKSCDQVSIGVWPQTSYKESGREDAKITYNSASRVSSYDTVAVPCSLEQRKSAFKVKPSSISYMANFSCMNNSGATTFDVIPEKAGKTSNNNRVNSKSNVFLRAARSITKTKSISGNFIVKTTICKNNQVSVAPKFNTNEQSQEPSVVIP